MKVSELKKIINECYQEVLNELDSDDTGVMKIAQNDPQKQQKVQTAKQNNQSYEVYDNTSLEEMETDFANDAELAEMARIPILYKLEDGWQDALESNEKLKKSSTIQGIINYLKEKPEGASILDIAKNAFDTPKRQQQLNPLFPALVDAGLVQNIGLKNEPKKPSQGKKDKGSKIDDETGEEMFGDEGDDAEDYAVGFAKDYGHIPSSGDEGEEMFNSDTETPSEEEPGTDFNEPEFGGDEPEHEGGGDEAELSKLTAEKDALISRLKNKEISKEEYRSLIGDIPSRIKALRAKLSGEEDIDEGPRPVFEGKRRLMKLAGLLKD